MDSEQLWERQEAYENLSEGRVQEAQSLVEELVQAGQDKGDTREAEEIYAELHSLISDEEIQTEKTYGDKLPNEVTEYEPEETEVKDLTAYKEEAVQDMAEEVQKTEGIREDVAVTEQLSAELELMGETELSQEIKDKADELKTPLAIYLFLKNNIRYENYFGSRKGAAATYDACAGNDVDQASLLIAMLRYRGYPARYRKGSILLEEDQALKLTGAKDVATAGKVMCCLGTPVTVLTEKGRPAALLVEHTWAEAYVPYTDYRGAGNNSGQSLWISLDTGVKEYKETESIYDQLEEQDLPVTDFEKAVADSDYNALEELLAGAEEALEPLTEEETVSIRRRQIAPESICYLPLSLQYSVVEQGEAFSRLEEDACDSITFSVDSQKLASRKASELYNKRIVVEYEPATEADEQLVAEYGSLFETPAYLVEVQAVLKLDGQEIARGKAVNLGVTQSFDMKVKSGKQTDTVSNSITAGAFYQVTMDMQTITGVELSRAEQEVTSAAEEVTVEEVYSDEYLGSREKVEQEKERLVRVRLELRVRVVVHLSI